jgi:hypothetical protein
MRGELVAVWPWTWKEIWEPLASHENAPSDLFCELYRELAKTLRTPLSIEQLADIIDDREQSAEAFRTIDPSEIDSEARLVQFFEQAHDVIEEFDDPSLSDTYFGLLATFLEIYSLRYDLQRPCSLSPTLPGLFASLVRDLRDHTSRDPHLNDLMGDFEHALRDLRTDQSDRRIKTCIQKQVNLLEAMGRAAPGVSHATLGRICDQLNTWPHDKVRESLKNLYNFASDYPGIRHGGTPSGANRTIGVRDLVSISILLVGFTPYLCEQMDPNSMYRGR